jgi:protease I
MQKQKPTALSDQKINSSFNKKVAILATDGFEEAELFEPKKALEQAGATVTIVSLKKGEIKGWKDNQWAKSLPVDQTLSQANAQDFDALMLPGGVINADKIRSTPEAVRFAGEFVKNGKPIAAICHAAWTLIETGEVRGRTLTSWPSLKTDLQNAGATWVDAEVIVDQNWVTSRKPDDLPAFNKKMIETFGAETNSAVPGLRYSATNMTADGLNIPEAYGNRK